MSHPIDMKHKYINSLYVDTDSCTKCNLCNERTHVVKGRTLFSGEINLNADIMFIGEAPGYYEDQEGLPFVGKSGKVLEDAIYELELEKDVFYTNVVRCRPEGNRDPSLTEIEACSEYLNAEINIINPKLIVAVGRFAGNALYKPDEPLTMRELYEIEFTIENRFGPIPVISIYHPSYLLRLRTQGGKLYNEFRDSYWEDFKSIKRKINDLRRAD